METGQEPFTKQFTALKEIREDEVPSIETFIRQGENIPNIPLQTNFDALNLPFTTNFPVTHGYSIPKSSSNDEPIDLTTFNNRVLKNTETKFQSHSFPMANCSQEGIIMDQSNDYHARRRRKRRKFAYTTDGKLVLVSSSDSLQSPSSFSESKQLEILKAAKSLFSKRTRTLYHWMYPNAAKQQIKAAVASSWESLGTQEKDFYISQVLGRFGFPQSSLMINPQLGGIKELPPIPDNTESKLKSRELQSAISSIMPENHLQTALASSPLTFEEFERRGRPLGSSNKRQKFDLNGSLTQDFKDDPELSQELQQFANIFNLNKI
ncbi:hypothetical protein NQ317_009803 [Molorchus minor]|uniref:Uncharacterized protein n=1 Tax=Molorchus minor TaxID=1323400 RepID=A0ABQ9JTC2_9CUCU|nr:hypothetical protein NQ317_009803 [Molorchus minor]